MKPLKPWLAGVGLCLSAGSALAVDVVELDFEGIGDTVTIGNFYNVGNPVAQLNYGVSFGIAQASSGPITTVRAVAYATNGTFPEEEGNLFFNAPSPFNRSTLTPFDTTTPPSPLTTEYSNQMRVMSSGGEFTSATESTFAVMNYSQGIDLRTLSFSYSSEQSVRVAAYGPGETIAEQAFIGEVTIDAQSVRRPCDNANPHRFCNWDSVSWLSDGSPLGTTSTAYSLRFYNDVSPNTHTLYDNIAFQSAQAVPEPSTYTLMALGLAGIGVFLRRRRQ